MRCIIRNCLKLNKYINHEDKWVVGPENITYFKLEIEEVVRFKEKYFEKEIICMKVNHEFEPIFDNNSRILILGSFPSVKSRDEGFYYGHPRNRFWSVLANIFETDKPNTIEDKIAFLKKNKIAVWDVVESCEIVGSSDSTIKNVVTNDINSIMKLGNIEQIFTNGKKANELYNKYILPVTKIESVCLPSTSPANATYTFDNLVKKWKDEIAKFY